ncbi:hypothetical protein J5X84_17585 [Streptosporangiaceae bacterium NEAU-GS5]|nr:hypothetical protein [Streptosporangiaceae bacterium NEAU-GS5]
MVKRISAIVAAMALGTATLIAGPAAHAAVAATVDSLSVSPDPAVVDDGHKVQVTFSFKTNVADDSKVVAEIGPKGGSAVRIDILAKTNPSTGVYVYTGTRDIFVEEATGPWTAKATVTGDGTTITGSASATKDFLVKHVWSTEIRGFDARPEPVRAGDVLYLSGRLVINSPHGFFPYKDQKVFISFRAKGSPYYKKVAWDVTNWRGEFNVGVKAFRDGYWRAEFEGSDIGKPSTSESDQVEVFFKPRPRPHPHPHPAPKADSRIVKFDAYPEPVKFGRWLYFHGAVQVWDHGWHNFGKTKVALYFKSKHGHWKYVKTIWTDGSGGFWSKTRAFKSGGWKVVFAGDKDVSGSSSRWDWVRVKHGHH